MRGACALQLDLPSGGAFYASGIKVRVNSNTFSCKMRQCRSVDHRVGRHHPNDPHSIFSPFRKYPPVCIYEIRPPLHEGNARQWRSLQYPQRPSFIAPSDCMTFSFTQVEIWDGRKIPAVDPTQFDQPPGDIAQYKTFQVTPSRSDQKTPLAYEFDNRGRDSSQMRHRRDIVVVERPTTF